ncbi:MAG: pirin family protein [Chitinophagaceae bacterium]
MITILHKSNTRGHVNHGWLDAHHSFSFGQWYNPERVHFGKLRVLNDDIVKAGFGFGKHPHDNMEIITIPLSGALEHKDSTGGHGVIAKNDVQVMSAGSGIEHSEFNHSKTEDVNLFQLWIFTNKENVAPRYDQKTFSADDRQNKFQTVVSPFGNEGLWIYQDAWISLGNFDAENSSSYQVKKEGNGIYLLVIEGEVEVDGNILSKRDAIGIWDTTAINFLSKTNTEILLVEVPMN